MSEKKIGRPLGESDRRGALLLGAKIRVLRLKAGMTQEQLGELIGAGGSMVSHWEAGKVPSTIYILRLVESFQSLTHAEVLETLEGCGGLG